MNISKEDFIKKLSIPNISEIAEIDILDTGRNIKHTGKRFNNTQENLKLHSKIGNMQKTMNKLELSNKELTKENNNLKSEYLLMADIIKKGEK